MNCRKAMEVVFAALALGLAPTPDLLPSAWAAKSLVVPDGPRAGERWSADLTPYLVEILDNMAAGAPFKAPARRAGRRPRRACRRGRP